MGLIPSILTDGIYTRYVPSYKFPYSGPPKYEFRLSTYEKPETWMYAKQVNELSMDSVNSELDTIESLTPEAKQKISTSISTMLSSESDEITKQTHGILIRNYNMPLMSFYRPELPKVHGGIYVYDLQLNGLDLKL